MHNHNKVGNIIDAGLEEPEEHLEEPEEHLEEPEEHLEEYLEEHLEERLILYVEDTDLKVDEVFDENIDAKHVHPKEEKL